MRFYLNQSSAETRQLLEFKKILEDLGIKVPEEDCQYYIDTNDTHFENADVTVDTYNGGKEETVTHRVLIIKGICVVRNTVDNSGGLCAVEYIMSASDYNQTVASIQRTLQNNNSSSSLMTGSATSAFAGWKNSGNNSDKAAVSSVIGTPPVEQKKLWEEVVRAAEGYITSRTQELSSGFGTYPPETKKNAWEKLKEFATLRGKAFTTTSLKSTGQMTEMPSASFRSQDVAALRQGRSGTILENVLSSHKKALGVEGATKKVDLVGTLIAKAEREFYGADANVVLWIAIERVANAYVPNAGMFSCVSTFKPENKHAAWNKLKKYAEAMKNNTTLDQAAVFTQNDIDALKQGTSRMQLEAVLIQYKDVLGIKNGSNNVDLVDVLVEKLNKQLNSNVTPSNNSVI